MQKFKAEKQYFLYDPFHPLIMFSSNFMKSKQVYNVIWLHDQTQASVGDSDCHKRNTWSCLTEIKIPHVVNIGQALFTVLIQSLSHVWLLATPWTAACQVSLSFAISWSLLKLMPIESVIPSDHLMFCCPFHFLLSIFPHIRSFPMSWLFASGGQSIGASVSTPVLPKNTQDWFPLGLTGLISLQSKGFLRVFSSTHSSKASTLWCSAFLMVQLSHPYMTIGKTVALTIQTFVSKVMSVFQYAI